MAKDKRSQAHVSRSPVEDDNERMFDTDVVEVDDDSESPPRGSGGRSKGKESRRRRDDDGERQYEVEADAEEEEDDDDDEQTAKLPEDLLTRILHEFFTREDTRISKSANRAVAKYFEIFA